MNKFALGFVLGLATAGASLAVAQMAVHVNTNGTLVGYIVQDSTGQEVCRDPSVWIQFRGPESYIVCP